MNCCLECLSENVCMSSFFNNYSTPGHQTINKSINQSIKCWQKSNFFIVINRYNKFKCEFSEFHYSSQNSTFNMSTVLEIKHVS